MVRKTSRRAYAPKKRAISRRRRSNPKGITQTPAFRYAGYAAAGAAGSTILNQTGFLAKTFEKPFTRSLAYAALTVLVAKMALKGRSRENVVAAAVGMVIPGLTSYVASMDLGASFKLGNGNGNGNGDSVTDKKKKSMQLAMMRSNPYSVAQRHAARTSGLTAIK